MRTRIVVTTLAGALLFFGGSPAAFAQGDAGPGYTPRCGYTHYCSGDSDDADSSGQPERYWNCRQDPFRDDESYGAPCRYSQDCTNYRRCED